jgi:hypothetical protein
MKQMRRPSKISGTDPVLTQREGTSHLTMSSMPLLIRKFPQTVSISGLQKYEFLFLKRLIHFYKLPFIIRLLQITSYISTCRIPNHQIYYNGSQEQRTQFITDSNVQLLPRSLFQNRHLQLLPRKLSFLRVMQPQKQQQLSGAHPKTSPVTARTMIPSRT